MKMGYLLPLLTVLSTIGATNGQANPALEIRQIGTNATTTNATTNVFFTDGFFKVSWLHSWLWPATLVLTETRRWVSRVNGTQIILKPVRPMR
jgi:hypothetical protein